MMMIIKHSMMTKKKLICMLLIACTALQACKKKNGDQPDAPDEPTIPGAIRVEHGEPIGEVTAKTIGPNGGELAIPNTTFKLTVPAGAVDRDVNFSVQQVNNTLPNGAASPVYRLLPEDVQFKKDVEISLPYDDASNMVQSLVSLTYQDKKGYWRVVKNPVVNRNNYTVTAKTRHFSDWVVVSRLSVVVVDGHSDLEKSESTELQLSFMPIIEEHADLDDLLGRVVKFDGSKVKEWRMLGTSTEDRGTLTIGSDRTSATYKAPSTYPERMTSHSIEVVLHPLDEIEKEHTARTRITLLSEEYSYTSIEGQSGRIDGNAGVEVYSGSSSTYANFRGHSGSRLHFEIPDQSLGTKPFGDNVRASFFYSDGNSDYYSSAYTECVPAGEQHTSGVIVLLEEKNGLITGALKGDLKQKIRSTPYCYGKAEKFYAKFRFKKR